MRKMMLVCALAAACLLVLAGCSTTPTSGAKQAELTSSSETAIQLAKKTDPGLQKFFDTAAAYAVFPSVGKGAIGVGGAYGRGELYEGGKLVGYCTLTQASIGLALGGQKYTELIFFEDKAAVDRFKSGKFRLRSPGLGRSAQVGRVGQCQVLQWCRRLHDGGSRPDVRGLRRRAEVQLRAGSGEVAGGQGRSSVVKVEGRLCPGADVRESASDRACPFSSAGPAQGLGFSPSGSSSSVGRDRSEIRRTTKHDSRQARIDLRISNLPQRFHHYGSGGTGGRGFVRSSATSPLPGAYLPVRQWQRVRHAPDAGSLGRTSVAVIARPFRLRPWRPRTARRASLRAGMPTNPNPLDSSPGRCFITSAVSTRPNDSKTSRRSLPVTSVGRLPTQISILCPFPLHRTLVFGGRAKQGERIRETGLEAGAAIGHERSCFKASSGDHPEFRTTRNRPTVYHPPAHTPVYLFFTSKIFLMCPPREKNGGNAETSQLSAKQRSPLRGIILIHTFRDGFPT